MGVFPVCWADAVDVFLEQRAQNLVEATQQKGDINGMSSGPPVWIWVHKIPAKAKSGRERVTRSNEKECTDIPSVPQVHHFQH